MIAPMYANRPQKLGAGTTTRYITMDFTIGTSATIVNLGDQLYSDNEVQNYMQRYNYMKIKNIKVKVTPSSTTGRIFLLGQWNAKTTTVTADEITNNDSTKIIALHAIRFQTRTWLPPDMNATNIDKVTVGESVSTINLCKYNRTDDYYYSKGTTPASYSILYPFSLAMRSTTSIEISLIIKINFRGEKYSTKLEALLQLYNNDNEIKNKIDNEINKKIIIEKAKKNEIFNEEKKENKDIDWLQQTESEEEDQEKEEEEIKQQENKQENNDKEEKEEEKEIRNKMKEKKKEKIKKNTK
jgi:hypothetical protein